MFRFFILVILSCLILSLSGCSILPWGADDSELKPVTEVKGAGIGGSTAIPENGEALAKEDEPVDVSPESEEKIAEKDVESKDVLVYWETIKGGFSGSSRGFGAAMDFISGGDVIQFIRPVAVSVRNDYLYVVDMGLNLVLRYNRVTSQIEPLVELKGLVYGDIADIYVAKDFSFYLTDTFGSRVLHFDKNGRLIRTLSDRLNLSHPVAVIEIQPTGNVLVADGQFDHIVVFDQLGDLVGAIGGRGNEPGKFLNITTMAIGPDGYYIAARVGQRIQVLSFNGDYLYSLEQRGANFPLAMAADDNFRVFVGDYLDNSIKVYERGRFVESFGVSGVGPGQFKRITDLWIEEGFLYVADSLNGRIQIMRVAADIPQPLPSQEP